MGMEMTGGQQETHLPPGNEDGWPWMGQRAKTVVQLD